MTRINELSPIPVDHTYDKLFRLELRRRCERGISMLELGLWILLEIRALLSKLLIRWVI